MSMEDDTLAAGAVVEYEAKNWKIRTTPSVSTWKSVPHGLGTAPKTCHK